MPVLEASDQLKVQPNHVYVIPRNAHMNVTSGVLSLSPRHSSPLPHMSIDPFLRSLAADQKSKAIGVILSGSASDGSLGMMAIKASGGITFAQSSDTAKYDGMPRSAVAAGCIDFVLSPRILAASLRGWASIPTLRRQAPGNRTNPIPQAAKPSPRFWLFCETRREWIFLTTNPPPSSAVSSAGWPCNESTT
jgi:two-component system CheB/CheR fusion protein